MTAYRLTSRATYLQLIIFLMTMAFSSAVIHAQEYSFDEYTDQHFTDENGLPQNSVKSIIADTEGYLWLTTEMGLVRYDGHQFLVFDKSVLPLRSNRMITFYPGNETGRADKSLFFALSAERDYLSIDNGHVSLRDSGLAKFLAGMPYSHEYNEGKAFMAQSLPERFKEVAAARIAITPDEKGGFFVCRPGKVSYYKGLQQQYAVALPVLNQSGFFRLGEVMLWADEKGVFRMIDRDSVRTLQLTGDILQHPGYQPGARNFEIYWSNASGQAFLYLGKSLYLLKTGATGLLGTQLVVSDFDCKINNISSIYYDEKNQLVFLGSLNKGLFTFSPRQFKTLSIGGEDKDNVYYGQAAWGKDSVLTTQGDILSLKGPSVLPIMKQEQETDRYSMLIDRRGFIWTKKGDLVNKFDAKGTALLARWDMGSAITQLYETKAGQIWVASDKMGLFRIDPFEAKPVPRPFPMQVNPQGISCLAQEGADILWIGTGVGLYRLNLKDGKVDTLKGLEKFYIRSLYIPVPGEIWITTYGAGFFLYSNSQLTTFPVDKAGYLSTAHCFVEDKRGFCWIPTNKGLFQVSKKDLLNYAAGRQQQVFYLYHTREEGFNTNEFNGGCQPCAVQLGNGYISLPSLNGVVWFSPDSLQARLPDRKIFIDKIEVDNVRIPLSDTITLSRRFKLFRLYFSTPYAGNEYNLDIKYALVKGDEKPVWLALDDNRIISLSSLVHGGYTLTIRKVDGFGADQFSYRKLVVIVPPAFFETYWFYGLMVLLFVFLLWLYARLRLRFARQKNRQLETMVGIRTGELTSALDALSVSEKNIRRQLHVRKILITSISHDIGSPLKYITMMAEELKDRLSAEKVADKAKQQADSIFQAGHYLYHLTRNLLQYLRIAELNSALKFEQFDLHRLVENKIFIFRPIAEERSLTIINRIPKKFYLYNDPLLLEVVIHNLLDNAVKATRQGIVTLRTDTIGAQTHLIIEDTGPGMREEVVKMFEETGMEENAAAESSYSGFGLKMVKELTRLIGVIIKIETGPAGTGIHLIFNDSQAGKKIAG